MGYLSSTIGYYEGDRQGDDLECPPRPSTNHIFQDGEWVLDIDSEINANLEVVMKAYEIDREKLNKAWLSALIAGGMDKASRQAIITTQMDALDAQLDADIEAIFIGE